MSGYLMQTVISAFWAFWSLGIPGRSRKGGERRHLQSTAEWAADQYEENFFLPIIFHNLKYYDAHFVVKHFQKKYTEYTTPDEKKKYGYINIIPLNKEKYLQFEIRELRFLASYQFLSTSLEELVSLLLKAGTKHLAHTQKYLGTCVY